MHPKVEIIMAAAMSPEPLPPSMARMAAVATRSSAAYWIPRSAHPPWGDPKNGKAR